MTLGWSPETICQRLRLEKLAHEQLSHDTIYRHIAEDRQQGDYTAAYHGFGKNAGKAENAIKQQGVSLIPERVDITERPKVVENRERIGDWEGDTVHGQNAHRLRLLTAQVDLHWPNGF